MAKEKYLLAAIDWVCEICRDYRLKYRRDDFTYQERRADEYINVAWDNPSGYYVLLRYDFPRNGKALKKSANEFLEYANVRVTDMGIMFSFTETEIDIHLSGVESSDDAERDKVIRKVQKLLAMTEENSCTENEALMASMQAQRLLAKHKMSLADLNGGNESEPIEQIVSDVGNGKNWRLILAEIVAESYCCKSFWIQGTSQVVFYGHKQDALIARRVFNYLFTVGNRLANSYVRKEKARDNSCSNLYTSFVGGFVGGVRSELQKQCTALALVVPQDVEEQYNAAFAERMVSVPTSKLAKWQRSRNSDAYNQGFSEGKRALNAQYLENRETQK